MRKTLREPALVLTLAVVVGLLGFFVIYPQLRVVLVPGLAGYVEFFREQTWVKPLLHSLQITVLSTTTAVTLGFVYAYAMVYSDMPWKRFFRLVGILLLLSPPFVVAASYILLFSPRVIISLPFLVQSPNMWGISGIWRDQTIAFSPIAYQLIANVMTLSDPSQRQAAPKRSATAWGDFRTVTLPLSRPGLAAA